MSRLGPTCLHQPSGDGPDGLVELYEAELESSVSWAGHLPPNSICLCFNELGEAMIMGGGDSRLYLRPQSLSLFTVGPQGPELATRIGGGRHRFVVLSIPRSRLAGFFGGGRTSLHPQFQSFLKSERGTGFGVMRPMWAEEKQLMEWLCRPPVPPAARDLWYRSKMGELLAVHLYATDREPFCAQQKRRANQFVDRALSHLQDHFEDPLELDALATKCGCSGSYLSRTVKRETGKTLQQHLRLIRVDAAARMLMNGANVTEAAFAVGYSSLSHFSKAFETEKGVLPSGFHSRE